jgi:hypothetical protein
MDKTVDYLVYSYNEKESQYVFKQTIRLLKDKILKFDYSKKTVAFANFTIRFCSIYEYERLHLQSLRAKEFYSRWFERQLDDYEKQNKEKGNG